MCPELKHIKKVEKLSGKGGRRNVFKWNAPLFSGINLNEGGEKRGLYIRERNTDCSGMK